MFGKRFWQDGRASVVPMFALASLVIIGSVGAAVDYGRAASLRSDLQAVLDAVALMLSKEAIGLSKKELNEKADVYMAALFNRPEAKNLKVKPTFVTENNTFRVTVEGSAAIDTTFARIFGQKKMQVTTTAEVAWEMRRLELALALDNTGSMSKLNKMTELKKAVKSLLKTLKETAKTPDHIKVAIVPFDTVVNIGAENKDAPWLRYDPGVDKASWNGCVQDRDQPYDSQDAAPSATVTYFPAANCTDGSNLVKVKPLTSDWVGLEQTINDMTPNGTTNVSIGLAWGWHALTSGAPLTQGTAPKADLDKIIVLLTDGTNTKNRWTNTSSMIDMRTKATCDNVKATGVKVYTIRVIEGNATLLQDCASNPSMFYDVKDATQLNAVFAAIGKNLANIRISK